MLDDNVSTATRPAAAPTTRGSHQRSFWLGGKRGLIIGVANDRSLAWGAARVCRSLGASLALTCINDKALSYVAPLAEQVEADLLMKLDLSREGELDAVFAKVAQHWGGLDFVVHSVAFASELHSRVADCSRASFLQAMDVSCWSFIRIAHLAEPLMPEGGCLVTYSYLGADVAVPNYNMMGPVKAALESATRYLATELGGQQIRVHAVSPGPVSTRAASGIAGFGELLAKVANKAPLRKLVDIDDVGRTTAFLVSDAGRHLTGSLTYVDGGYHIVD